MYKPTRVFLSALIFLTLLMGVTPVSNVHAITTWIVTTNADSGGGSLRQTILDAGFGDTINFAASLSGQTILLGSSLTLDKNLTIDGSSLASHIKVSGSGSHIVFTVSSGRIVTLNHLDIINGEGGIQNAGTLTVTNSTISGNNSALDGGGIYNSGTVTVTNSTLSGNSAGTNGGGIYNSGTVTVANSTLSGNSAGTNGGAIYNSGTVTVMNSTLSINSAANGGSVHNGGIVTVTNSTLSTNSATTNGGGINNLGTLTVTNSTLSANSAATNGSGIYNGSAKTLNYANTIIANSTGGGDCVNSGGSIGTNTNNLVEDNSCSPTYSGDPLLGSLANNGGPTQTIALLNGSSAIDAGHDTTCAAAPVNNLDQRGVTRPKGTQCDIGSYEFVPVIYHVKWNATGTNNGTSWVDAFTSLQSAIAAASGGDQIWVAAGTYTPHASDRTVSFTLKNGVGIYGGFGGTETLFNQRNPFANVTILSGDLNGNDNGFTNNGENSYHVVAGGGTNSTARLDGFTVKGGNANGGGSADFGGGIYDQNSSPTLKNVTFSGNSASSGGGMYNFTSSPTLTNVTFNDNSATLNGGGMYNQNSGPALTSVTFSSNSASSGGGMFNISSSPTLMNATFSSNSASSGGGMFNNTSNPTLTNVTFSGNSASSGGGIYNQNSSPTITNVIIANSTSGGDCANNSSTLNVASANNLIEDAANACGLTNNVNGNIIGSDPKLGPLASNGGSTQTHALLPGSPAIDTGSACPTTDQRGVARPQGSYCDIGSYEAILLTVTADSQSKTYGAPDPTFTFQYSGFIDGDTSSVIDTPPTCTVLGAHVNVNSYTITCSGGLDDKYIFVYVNGTLTITKATPTLSVTNSPVAYDGLPHSATVTGSVPGTVSNILTGGSATQTNVGTYAVTANFTPTDTTNYNGLTNASAGNFIISPDLAPIVNSVKRLDPNPTNIASVGFTVVFSESVTGVDASDFTLTITGIIGASITGVSGSGATYTVTVNTGSGSGTIRLDVADNDSIQDATNNPLGGVGAGNGNYTSGEIYTVYSIDTTGVFRPSNGLLYLKNANTTGFADVAINYGLGGDYPVVGDWDGNGTATIGIYRNGSFYLRNSNTLGFANLVFTFGQLGDQPIAGDWNGDGIDTIGIYRSSTGQFLMRNSNTSGTPDMSFYLGNVGDVGIAGDWNGDGLDTTGVFRPSNGIIFLKNTNETGFADIALNYGLAGDMPVTGDWNGDGIDTIGVYRNAQFLLRNSNTIGFAEIVFGLGNPGDMPIAGDWNGLP